MLRSLRVPPPEADADEWREFLTDVAGQLTESCRTVDPASTDKGIEAAQAEAEADEVRGEGG